LGDALLWFFIFILLGASVLVFVVQPQSWLHESVNPVILDAANMREMVFERLTAYEFPYGDIEYDSQPKLIDLSTINSNNLLSLSDKEIACKVKIKQGTQTVRVMFCGGDKGEELYKHANALPYKYKRASDTRLFALDDEHKSEYTVTVSIVVKKEGYNE
jgi:hypothetical protein